MISTLNREEAQIDQTVSKLQETVGADIAAFAQTSPSDESGRKLQSQIQRNTALLRARLRDLELLAEEQETIEEGDAVVAVVTQHKRRYEELQKALRNANLEVQRRTAQAAQEQRRALMGSGDYLQRAQQLKTQQDFTNSAADTTASLQRTRQLMAEELQHTSATLAAMETSEATLKAANKQYKGQRGTIKQSHQLLRTMRVNSFKDSLKLYAALAFFTAVMAYIGLRRMSYFVPEVVINSLPSLRMFGIGQSQGNSSIEVPYSGQQQYDVPGTQGGGREGHSTAGVSPFQSSLAEAQRYAGIMVRQAAHYGRRLAIWLVQQSQIVIAGINQKIEEQQARKLDPSYPPEENGKESSLEAVYEGASMLANMDGSGANGTVPNRVEDGKAASNQTVALEAAKSEQSQPVLPSASQSGIQGEPSLPGSDHESGSMNAPADGSSAMGPAGVARETAYTEQDDAMQQQGDSGMTESAISDTPEDDTPHLPRQGTMPEPPMTAEDSGATLAADSSLQLDEQQEEEEGVEGTVQQQDPASEEKHDSPHLPQQGTMPEPPTRAEDSGATPVAETPVQADEQHEEKGGVEGSVQQQDPASEEKDDSAGKEAAAAVSRDRAPSIANMGKIRWPEEGPSRPKEGSQEVQRTGGVGMSGGMAAGSVKDGGVTGEASGAFRMTESTASTALPEKEREEDAPASEVIDQSEGERRVRMTGITDSHAMPEKVTREEVSASEEVEDSDGESDASEKALLMEEDPSDGVAITEQVSLGHNDADAASLARQTKDEL